MEAFPRFAGVRSMMCVCIVISFMHGRAQTGVMKRRAMVVARTSRTPSVIEGLFEWVWFFAGTQFKSAGGEGQICLPVNKPEGCIASPVGIQREPKSYGPL